MDDKTTKNKIKCLSLETPEDARDLICDVLTEIRDGRMMVECAGEICNLLQFWLRCYEASTLAELEERVASLEAREGKR